MYDEFDNGEPKMQCSSWDFVTWAGFTIAGLGNLLLDWVLYQAGVLSLAPGNWPFDLVVITSWLAWVTFAVLKPRSFVPFALLMVTGSIPVAYLICLIAQGT